MKGANIECLTSRWGGGGFPWDVLTKSGVTSGHICRTWGVDNDSEATEGTEGTVQCFF